MCRGVGSKDHCLDDHGQHSHDSHTPHPSVSPVEQILVTIAFVWNSVLIIHTNDVQCGKERTQTHTTGKVSKSFVAHAPPPPEIPSFLNNSVKSAFPDLWVVSTHASDSQALYLQLRRNPKARTRGKMNAQTN